MTEQMTNDKHADDQATGAILLALAQERREQREIYGNAHDDEFSRDEWVSLLTRELGSVATAVWDGRRDDYQRELVHLAAVAVAAIEANIRYNGD